MFDTFQKRNVMYVFVSGQVAGLCSNTTDYKTIMKGQGTSVKPANTCMLSLSARFVHGLSKPSIVQESEINNPVVLIYKNTSFVNIHYKDDSCDNSETYREIRNRHDKVLLPGEHVSCSQHHLEKHLSINMSSFRDNCYQFPFSSTMKSPLLYPHLDLLFHSTTVEEMCENKDNNSKLIITSTTSLSKELRFSECNTTLEFTLKSISVVSTFAEYLPENRPDIDGKLILSQLERSYAYPNKDTVRYVDHKINKSSEFIEASLFHSVLQDSVHFEHFHSNISKDSHVQGYSTFYYTPGASNSTISLTRQNGNLQILSCNKTSTKSADYNKTYLFEEKSPGLFTKNVTSNRRIGSSTCKTKMFITISEHKEYKSNLTECESDTCRDFYKVTSTTTPSTVTWRETSETVGRNVSVKRNIFETKWPDCSIRQDGYTVKTPLSILTNQTIITIYDDLTIVVNTSYVVSANKDNDTETTKGKMGITPAKQG